MLPHVICYSRGDKVPEGYKIINTIPYNIENKGSKNHTLINDIISCSANFNTTNLFP